MRDHKDRRTNSENSRNRGLYGQFHKVCQNYFSEFEAKLVNDLQDNKTVSVRVIFSTVQKPFVL